MPPEEARNVIDLAPEEVPLATVMVTVCVSSSVVLDGVIVERADVVTPVGSVPTVDIVAVPVNPARAVRTSVTVPLLGGGSTVIERGAASRMKLAVVGEACTPSWAVLVSLPTAVITTIDVPDVSPAGEVIVSVVVTGTPGFGVI